MAASASGDHSAGAASAVSTASTARSPSASTPTTLALGLAAVGEGDLGRAVAKVVGAGQDLTGGDHDARTAAVAADGDGGGIEALGDGGDGLLELIESGHNSSPSNLRTASHSRTA